MIADCHEQLDTGDVQEPELGRVQPFTEAARIAFDPLTGKRCLQRREVGLIQRWCGMLHLQGGGDANKPSAMRRYKPA